MREVQRIEKEKQAGKESSEGDSKSTPAALDNTESDTETENMSRQKKAAGQATTQTTTTSASLQAPGETEEIRKRSSMSGDSSGYGSTDSEWEKVDDNAASS